ncbi:MAG: hypothetical protein ABR955_03645 [Verrucomicrobiota bacterium]
MFSLNTKPKDFNIPLARDLAALGMPNDYNRFSMIYDVFCLGFILTDSLFELRFANKKKTGSHFALTFVRCHSKNHKKCFGEGAMGKRVGERCFHSCNSCLFYNSVQRHAALPQVVAVRKDCRAVLVFSVDDMSSWRASAKALHPPTYEPTNIK